MIDQIVRPPVVTADCASQRPLDPRSGGVSAASVIPSGSPASRDRAPTFPFARSGATELLVDDPPSAAAQQFTRLEPRMNDDGSHSFLPSGVDTSDVRRPPATRALQAV
jgi:hypothetical protein